MKDGPVYNKFNVSRTDGRDVPGGDKEDAVYFVLDLVHDRNARFAMLAYKVAAKRNAPELAEDIERLLQETEQAYYAKTRH